MESNQSVLIVLSCCFPQKRFKYLEEGEMSLFKTTMEYLGMAFGTECGGRKGGRLHYKNLREQ